MKTLIMLRHATAPLPARGEKDFDRHLNETGRAEAALMSHRLAAKNLYPDWIMASAASRTRDTAKIFAGILETAPSALHFNKMLYNASADRLLDVITSSGIPDDRQTLLIIAHNPGISELAKTSCPTLPFQQLPPCGMVAVQLNISRWVDCSFVDDTLLFFDFPNSK